MDDLVKVIVDYSMTKKGKKKVDTGGWKRIHKGSKVDDKPTNMGLNLCLEGTAIKKKCKNIAKVSNVQLNIWNSYLYFLILFEEKKMFFISRK